MFHDHHFVTVSDERGDAAKTFKGILLGPAPVTGETQNVATFITDADNGFGWGVGCTVAPLKRLADGNYGS